MAKWIAVTVLVVSSVVSCTASKVTTREMEILDGSEDSVMFVCGLSRGRYVCVDYAAFEILMRQSEPTSVKPPLFPKPVNPDEKLDL